MTKEERELRREQREHMKRMEAAAKEAGRGPIDVPFLLLVLLLVGMGLIMLLSASFPSAYYETGDPLHYFKRQAIFAALGLGAMAVVGRINYARFRGAANIALGVSIILLAMVVVPGVGITSHGATRWLGIPGTDLQFQPSEIAKLGVILYFADSISKKKDKMKTIRYGIVPYLAILGIIAFLMSREPHFSGMVLIVGIGAAMMFVGGIRAYWVGLGVGGIAAVAYAFLSGLITYNSSRIAIWLDPLNDAFKTGTGYQTRQSLIAIGSGGLLGLGLGKSRQKFLFLPEEHNDCIFSIVCEELNSSRIAIWLDPLNDAFKTGAGYQTRQSLIAIGSGGLLGLGLGKSRQKFLFLPEEHNDCIFSIVCEELGLIGATLIMAIFALLIIRGYWIALHARDRFGSLLVVGVTTQIALQVFLNIAVVTNLVPNTGISLPFFSYGGTALAIQLAEMGVVLSVSRQMPPT